MLKKSLISAFVIVFYSSLVLGQKKQILLIGTYHEASPASSVFNAPVGDVLNNKQIDDIELLSYYLAKWKPTHLLTTLPQSTQVETELKYKTFLNKPNEFLEDLITQFAFRTAQKYSQTQLINMGDPIPIDFSTLISFAESHQQAPNLLHIQRLAQPVLFSQRQTFLKEDYFSFLQYLNTPTFASVLRQELASLPTIGLPNNPIGAQLASDMMQKTAEWITAMQQLKEPQKIVFFFNIKYLPALLFWLENNRDFEVLTWGKVIPQRKKKTTK